MEEELKRETEKMKTSYSLFWLVALFLIVLGEFELLPVGILIDNFKGTFVAETVGILFTAICVPLALKLFALVLNKKIDAVSFPVALTLYKRWSIIRLLILGVALFVNILLYYLTLSNTGLLCTLIILTASLFCVPSQKQLFRDLHLSSGEPDSKN